MSESFVYLIGCSSGLTSYVKIGRTVNIQRRLSNIQTGCPFPITHSFAILSSYEEEIAGLEKLLHQLLDSHRIRGEWYEGSTSFFHSLSNILTKVNAGNFTHEEILDLPDSVGPEVEVMMHRHEYEFRHIRYPLRKGRHPLNNSSIVSSEEISKLLLESRHV